MGEEKPSPSGQRATVPGPVSWEDVGSDRTFRSRRPLGPLVDNCSQRPGQHKQQCSTPAAAASPDPVPPTGDEPSHVAVDGCVSPRGRAQGDGSRKGLAGSLEGRGLALKAEGAATREISGRLGARQQQQQQQHQRQHKAGRGVPQVLRQEGAIEVGATVRWTDNRRIGDEAPTDEEAGENSHTGTCSKYSNDLNLDADGAGTDFSFRPHTEDSITHIDIDTDTDAMRAARRGGTASWSNSSRVRGFHDMICVGFAVSLCLNLGSLTARREGFFAAEVKCLPEGAAQTVLPDLGIWVGWRQAVANDQEPVVLNLEDLSMVGAAMGILTVVGHATDALLNAVGLAVLLYGRRKPLQEAMCRLVKRLCLASLGMAGWLVGMTVIGFLVVVKGPIGAAAVAFYTDLSLYCRSSVSVSVDYAYAMTTLTVLCQFFIGVVALPTPSSSSWRDLRRCRCCSVSRCWCCRSINPVGFCCFLLWRARSCCCRCCFPSCSSPRSDNDPTGLSDVGPSSSRMGAKGGSDKLAGPVAGTGGGAGSAETPSARLEHV